MNATVSRKQVLFPPGRVLQGSLYKMQDKDMDGRPKVYPPGHAKAGQPKVSWFFAVGVRKNQGENAWWDTPWGREVLAVGQAGWPQGQWQRQDFAWKIEDGDSQTPNKRGRKNCNTEGMPGCWIINFSSTFAPKICDETGRPILEPDVVKTGYWVEVFGSVSSNETPNNPGVYVNHEHVAFRGRDKEIFTGTDPAAVGFGRAAIPSHVSMAPVGNAAIPSAVGATPGVPSTPAVGYPMPSTPATPQYPGAPATPVPGVGYQVPGTPAIPQYPGAPPAAASVPVPVQPNVGFIAPPMPGVQPPVPPAVAQTPAAPTMAPAAYTCPLGAPPGFRMANVAGPQYAAFRSQRWTDEQLVQAGHMVRL